MIEWNGKPRTQLSQQPIFKKLKWEVISVPTKEKKTASGVLTSYLEPICSHQCRPHVNCMHALIWRIDSQNCHAKEKKTANSEVDG